VRAGRAALAAVERLERLRARWSGRGSPAPGFRIGLHTAELVAGEIGSAERGAYGIVGDGMNLAARIESANKLYGTRVLLSEATRTAFGPAFLLREIDLVRVVGRKQPVRLFELVAHAAAAGALARRVCALQRARRHTARARFAPRARCSRAARQRARRRSGARPAQRRASGELARNPPPPDWDAVFALETK
jgi:adenylate cyclase